MLKNFQVEKLPSQHMVKQFNKKIQLFKIVLFMSLNFPFAFTYDIPFFLLYLHGCGRFTII